MNIIQKFTQRFSKPKKRGYEIDMVNGPILPNIIKFSFPLMISSMLQLLFNAADIIVVGQYAGPTALAAVGSTASITFLIITIFMGLAVGVNVIVARLYGAKDEEAMSKAVHTSIFISIVVGIALIFVGYFLARPLLELMGSPDDVIDKATLYMQIFFVGMPASMVYNFGASILRAVGDTKRPLYFLSVAGVLNVVVNLVLVIVFSMGVAGVAIATVLAQYLSAFLVVLCLVKSNGAYKLNLKKIKPDKGQFISIVKVGVPAGIQSMMFSLSNTLVQSSINSFGSDVMAGSTAAGNIDGFIYVALNAVHQATVSFIAQNIGAKKYSRINKIVKNSMGTALVIGVTLSAVVIIFGRSLLAIYNSDPQVIEYGMIRLYYIVAPYFLCGVMEIMLGALRGLGYSLVPTIISLVGTCILRIVWTLAVVPQFYSLEVLFSIYGITWIVTPLGLIIYFIIVRRRLPKKDG